MDDIKGIKLLLNYEVREEKLQAYYEFIMGRYLPALQSLGFQMSDAWHTAYGEAPNRMIGFVCKDEETMSDLLNNEMWGTLNEQLEEFVIDFDYKFIPYRGGFQF